MRIVTHLNLKLKVIAITINNELLTINQMLNSVDAVPPTSRGTPCTLLSKVTGAQVCDARDDD